MCQVRCNLETRGICYISRKDRYKIASKNKSDDEEAPFAGPIKKKKLENHRYERNINKCMFNTLITE